MKAVVLLESSLIGRMERGSRLELIVRFCGENYLCSFIPEKLLPHKGVAVGDLLPISREVFEENAPNVGEIIGLEETNIPGSVIFL